MDRGIPVFSTGLLIWNENHSKKTNSKHLRNVSKTGARLGLEALQSLDKLHDFVFGIIEVR